MTNDRSMEEMAEKSFVSKAFEDRPRAEQSDEERKAKELYSILRGLISPELQGLLFGLCENYDNIVYQYAKDGYKEGFKHALTA